MQKRLKLFRYSGSKYNLLPFFRPLPSGIKRVVEPYLGSGSFCLNVNVPALGFEINEDVYLLWKWLKTVTPTELKDLYDLVEANKNRRADIREFKLDKGPQTYLKVNCCSVMTGQLSSWRLYPKHKLPIESTIRCLPRLKDIEVVYGSGELFLAEEGDLMFIDPPYITTRPNYFRGKRENILNVYDPKMTMNLISINKCPIIFTYGTNAPKIFPDYQWETITTAKVPNVRRGGTTKRIEHVVYINF